MADSTIKPDSGNDLVLQNNGGTGKIEVNDGAEVKVTTGSASGDDFTVNSTQLVVEGDSGNVGVGTASPTSSSGNTLEIYDANTPTFKLNDGGDYKSYIKLAGNDLEIRGSSGKMEFYTGNADGESSTEKMHIDSSGNVEFSGNGTGTDDSAKFTLGTGTSYFTIGGTAVTSQYKLRFANHNGIVGGVKTLTNSTILEVNKSGSSGGGIEYGSGGTASLLDDYEEGEWTPAITSSDGDDFTNYDGRVGRYTKIGRLVTAICYIDGGTKASMGGNVMRISGLPFTPNGDVSYQATAIGYWHNFGIGSLQVYASVYSTNTFAYLFKSGTNKASDQITPSDISNQCSIALTAIYNSDS